jgi:hypothetical protein
VKIIELRNQSIQASKNTGPDNAEVFRLMLTDKGTGDVTWLAFGKDVRDELVRQLTGGIVLAGGELPRRNGSR